MAAQVVVACRLDRGGSPCCACSTEVFDLDFLGISGPSAHMHTWHRTDWWDGQRSIPCDPFGIPGSDCPASAPAVGRSIFVHEIILGESGSVHRVSFLQSHDGGFRLCGTNQDEAALINCSGRSRCVFKTSHDGASW